MLLIPLLPKIDCGPEPPIYSDEYLKRALDWGFDWHWNILGMTLLNVIMTPPSVVGMPLSNWIKKYIAGSHTNRTIRKVIEKCLFAQNNTKTSPPHLTQAFRPGVKEQQRTGKLILL